MHKRVLFRVATRKAVYEKCGGRCAYCGIEIAIETMTVDHIRPLVYGGGNEIENLNPSCKACNNYKGVFSVEDFRRIISRQIENCRKYSMNFRTAERFGFITAHVPPEIVFHFERCATSARGSDPASGDSYSSARGASSDVTIHPTNTQP